MEFTAPLKSKSIKILLLGSGELGKEVIIEAQRLGIETVAVDSYNNAPAQLVANKAYTINMKNKEEVLDVIRKEKPDYILPEVSNKYSSFI
jgi:phosphoribosylglycinamide formyltransferase 2